jgi:hypothetical protein
MYSWLLLLACAAVRCAPFMSGVCYLLPTNENNVKKIRMLIPQ